METNNVVQVWDEKAQKEADLAAKIKEKECKSCFEVQTLEIDVNGDDDEENDLMNRLDYLKLETIYNDYNIIGGDKGLDLKTFIKVMTQENHLGVKPDPKDNIRMIRSLIDLFRQIDVNNDKTLEWVEFTNHIIEMGMVRKDRTFIDAIKNYQPSDIKDSKHDTEVEHMYYLDKLKHLLVMERDSKRFKVYNSRTGKMMFSVPEKQTGEGGAFIAADYVEMGNLKFVATTTNNNQINFWDSNNYIFRDRMNTSAIQLTVKWAGGNINRLFTGGVDCVVHMYDVQQLREVGMREGYTPAKKDEDYYHKDAVITDLLPIPELGLLASAGMSSRSPQSSSDNKICLWRMDTLQPKPPLIGHDRGVYSLDWYKDNHLILSAGLDHDVMIWNPHVNKKIFALKGHNHSLVGVKWMPGTNQIISGDISGQFRVWDVRTFATIQTFNCPGLNEINCLAVTQPPKRIIAGGRKLVFYDYNEPTGHNLADDEPAICVLYNPVFYTFITAHAKCIKVWDASNGSLQSVFRDLSKSDITAICMDERNRKLFVGDQGGRTRSINIKNGQKIKSFKKPKKGSDREKEVISGLMYWGVGDADDEEEQVIKNQIMTTSWDSLLRFFDDDEAESRVGELRSEMSKHQQPINFLDFKMIPSTNAQNSRSYQGIIATASDDGQIVIYNHSNHRHEGTLVPHAGSKLDEVKICKFLKGYDCVVSADVAGYLNFYAITPSPIKNKLLARCIDYNEKEIVQGSGGKGNKIAFPIRGIDFDPQRCMLYTGDEMGYMTQWDLTDLLSKLEDVKTADHHDKRGGDSSKDGIDSGAFITSTNRADKIKFSEADVKLVYKWKAHTDAINWITWVPDLSVVASCSYDCNVYMWDKDAKMTTFDVETDKKGEKIQMSEIKGVKMGSLVLGNKASAPGADPDPETARYRRGWKVEVDKLSRFNAELQEADEIWQEVQNYDYKEMKSKAIEKAKKKEAQANQGSLDQQKGEKGQKQLQGTGKGSPNNRQHGQKQAQQASGEMSLDQMTDEERDRAMLNR